MDEISLKAATYLNTPTSMNTFKFAERLPLLIVLVMYCCTEAPKIN